MRSRIASAIVCVCIAGGLSLPSQRSRGTRVVAAVPQTNPYSSAADVEAGRKLYIGRCGHCHGQNGEGGRGAVLNSGQFHHGATDRDLYLVIRTGIPNTEMPGTFNLPEADVWRMAAYVKRLGLQGAAEPASGDAPAGALVYRKSGCAQ